MAEVTRRLFLTGAAGFLLAGVTAARWRRRYGRYTGYRGGYRG